MTHTPCKRFGRWALLILWAASLMFPAHLSAQEFDTLSGRWKINANNYRGRLEFSREGRRYMGRAMFEDRQRWEELVNIRFEPHRGVVEFDRPEASQHYVGHLVSGDRMEGRFNGDYGWWAERAADRDEGEHRETPAITGDWMINANNYPGKLEFSIVGDHLVGRIFIDANNHWERLTDLNFDPDRRTIEFDRPEARQHYVGRLMRDNRIEGTFSGGQPWFAERR